MKFKDNKYNRWYHQIIENRRANPYDGYVERHHIIPKSMGGSNSKDNIVALTAREHFICHWLLTKMTDSRGMRLALLTMCRTSGNQERYKISSRRFQKIREQASIALTGANNPMYGKTHSKEARERISEAAKGISRPHTDEAKQKISEANKGRKHSKETRERWSKIRKGRPGQDNNSGKSWWNNGERSVLSHQCPTGFVKGRLVAVSN